MSRDVDGLLGELVAALGERSLALAESFTCGAVAERLGATEGSMSWFAGSAVTYTREAKAQVLGVEVDDLVSPECASQMATAASQLFGVDAALSVTGAAGPDPLDGHPPGTVVVGWCVDDRFGAEEFALSGDPSQVIDKVVPAALEVLVRQLQGPLPDPDPERLEELLSADEAAEPVTDDAPSEPEPLEGAETFSDSDIGAGAD